MIARIVLANTTTIKLYYIMSFNKLELKCKIKKTHNSNCTFRMKKGSLTAPFFYTAIIKIVIISAIYIIGLRSFDCVFIILLSLHSIYNLYIFILINC